MFKLNRAHATKALVLALAAGGLWACGESKPTTRVDESTATSTPTATVRTLRVDSPVLIEQATVKLHALSSQTLLGTQTLSSGFGVEFPLDVTRLPADAAGRMLMVELAPTNAASRYYDPIKQAMLPLTKPLHALLVLPPTNELAKQTFVKVSPFSQLAFDRALAQLGTTDTSAATLQRLIPDVVEAALAETQATFVVTTADTGLHLDATNPVPIELGTPTQGTYATRLMEATWSIGHVLMAQARLGATQTPWMDYADAVKTDFADGDLDGRTLAGWGDSGLHQRQLTSSVMPVATPENTDPDRNMSTLLQRDQRTARSAYTRALGALVKAELAPRLGSTEAAFLQALDFATLGESGNAVGTPVSGQDLHGVGVGNYTPAFGLVQGKTVEQGLSVSQPGGDHARLEALAGRYSGSNGCILTLTETGEVTLKQGTTSVTTTINQEIQDNLTRATSTATRYTLNVGKVREALPLFIALDLQGSQVLSASAGTATEVNPAVLVNPQISCSIDP